MTWTRKKVLVEKTDTAGSRRRKDIGGASVVEGASDRFAFFGAKGDAPRPSWLTFERMIANYWKGWPQLEGFTQSEIGAPFLDPVTYPRWAVDGQYGSGVRFDTKANENWEWHQVYDMRPALIEPNWPRPSWCAAGAKNPSVIELPGGVPGTDDLLSDTKSLAVQAVFYLQESPRHGATLLARGDCWRLFWRQWDGVTLPGLRWEVRLEDGTVWSIDATQGFVVKLNQTYLVTGFFQINGTDATLSIHVGRIDLTGTVTRTMDSEAWSDNHTGSAPELMDSAMEPVTLLNSWCGRHPWSTAAGQPAGSVGCVRVLTEIDYAYYDNLTPGFEGPFYQDCLGLPTLSTDSIFGTVALRWSLDENTGAVKVLDTSEYERYDALVTAGVEWTTVPQFARLWLTANAPAGQDYILVAGSPGAAGGAYEVISRMQQRLDDGTNPQIIFYNPDRSQSQTVNIDNIYRTANPGEYRLDFASGSIAYAGGYPGTFPDTLEDCSYAVLMDGAGAEETENIIGVQLSAAPADGSMVYCPPAVARHRYVMAYEGIVDFKEIDPDTGDLVPYSGKAICVAVANDPMEFSPGGLGASTWTAAYRCQPLVLSTSLGGANHKDIGHPTLVKISGLLYLLWAQETTIGGGVYDIWGMLIGNPSDIWTKNYVVCPDHVAGNATAARVLAIARNTNHWDGNSMGSIDLVAVGQSLAACYSALKSGGEWEIGVPLRITGPLTMDRATSSTITDTTDAGGVDEPSAPFWEGDPAYILARSRTATSGGTGSLVLYENEDGWLIREDDKLEDEDVLDEWDETSAGEHGSANAVRGLAWWKAPDGEIYVLVAAGSNVYWAENVKTTPNGWELATQIPARRITDSRLYIRTARSFVHMEPTPGALFICLPGGSNTEVGRWTTDEIFHRAAIPTGGTPALSALASGGALEDGSYSVKIAWKRDDEHGSAGSAVPVTLSGGGSAQAIKVHLNDAFADIWGADKSVYTHNLVNGVIAYIDPTGDGVYYKIQEFVLDPSDTFVTITSAVPATTVDTADTDRAGPPRATFCMWDDEVMFYNDTESLDEVAWSRQGEPCVCPAANRKQFAPLFKMTAFGRLGRGRRLVYGDRGIWVGYGSPNASGGGLSWMELSKDHGTPWFNSHCSVGSGWEAFYHNRKVWFTDGSRIIDAGRPLGPLWETVSASYEDRVVMQYHPTEDRLYCFIPSKSNIPKAGAFLDRPLHALGSLEAEVPSRWSWWPMADTWINVACLNVYGELMAGDSRDGRVYQLDHGGDDDNEDILAHMLTSTSYGRGPETLDDWAVFIGHMYGKGGEIDVTVIVDDGDQRWIRGMRVSPDPAAFGRGAGAIQLGLLQLLANAELGDQDRMTLPVLKGRSACVEVRFRGKDQEGKVRELILEINNANSSRGAERYTGRTQGGHTPIRWGKFVATDLHTDPAELPPSVLASSSNMDPRLREAVVVRRGRRNIWADRRGPNSAADGAPE